jgi:signal peptidase I
MKNDYADFKVLEKSHTRIPDATMKKRSDKNQPGRKTMRPEQPTLMQEIIYLLIKIDCLLLVFGLLVIFVFGLIRYSDAAMEPAVQDGDLVLFYRLDKDYVASDVVVLDYEGRFQVQRVVAVAGDTVDITDEGLFINGALQEEPSVYERTIRYLEGIDFPVTLNEGEVFVLGDNRDSSTDSRIYGPVKAADTCGKVMTVIRRRNF